MGAMTVVRCLFAFLVFGVAAGCGGGGAAAPIVDPPPAPTLDSIDVAIGPEAGGTPITLSGADFVDPAEVTVDGVLAVTIMVVDPTTITCLTPAGTAGAARDIVVTVPGGSATLVGAFTYAPAPAVTDVVPGNGPAAGGTTITVAGTGFSVGVSEVKVGPGFGTTIMVASDTSLTCVTPAGSGIAAVSVTTPGGIASKGSAFVYDTPLVLTGASPDSGFAPGGTWMTLTGSGFSFGAAGVNTVTIGGTSATNVVAQNDTTITCTAPSGTVGAKKNVQVSNGNGTATLSAFFEYFAFPPKLTTPNKRIDPGTAGTVESTAPQLLCNGNTIYALWHEGSNSARDVTFSRSTDGGANWSTPVKLNTNTAGASDSISASMCRDGQNLYVVFRDDRNNTSIVEQNDVYFQKSTNGGVSWLSSDVRINTPTAGTVNARYPQICCNGQKVVVAWTDERASTNQYKDVRIQRSSDGGANWLTSDVNVRDATAGSEAATLRIECCGSNFYLVWRDTRNHSINADIYFTASTNDGATWLTNNLRLNTDTAGTAIAQLPMLSCQGNEVYAIWSDGRNGKVDVYYQRSTNKGAAWLSTDVRINTDTAGGSYSINPFICCGGGHVYVTWADDRNSSGNHDTYFRRSTNSGASFLSPDVRISTDTAGSAQNSVPWMSCSAGSVFVTWVDDRNWAGGDIYYTCSDDAGANWLTSDVRLNDDTAGTNYHERPRVCSDGARALFAWSDNRSHLSISDLYVTATTP